MDAGHHVIIVVLAHLVALGVALGGDEHRGHQILVVGELHVEIHTAVLAGVEGQILAVDQTRCLSVDGKVKFVRRVFVVLRAVRVHIGLHRIVQTGVVGQSRAEGAADVGGKHLPVVGVIIALAEIDAGAGGVELVGVEVGDLHLDLLRAAQQTGLQVVQCVNTAAVAHRQGDLVLAGGRLLHALGQVEQVVAHVEQIGVAHQSGDLGGIDRRGLAAEFVHVEDGRLRPVSVEGQERDGQRGVRRGGQDDIALDIDAIVKVGVEIGAVFCAQRHGDGDGRVAARGDGDRLAV